MESKIIEDISNFIFMKDTPKKADIIFLPGSPYPDQPKLAAELFKEGYAPRLIPSGKYAMGLSTQPIFSEKEDYKTESAYFSAILRQNGVPDSAILEETEARYTKQNADFTKKRIEKEGISISSALLVCRAFHARRAYLYYKMAFPEIEITVIPTTTIGITKENWFQQKDGIDLVLGELEKCRALMGEATLFC